MTPKEKTIQRKMLTTAHFDFNKGMNSHAFFKVNNRDISDDLVSETFLKTWRYLSKGGQIKIIRAFLYHILNNLIIDQYRKHKTMSLDALVEKGFEPSTDNHDNFLNFLDGKKAIRLISELPLTYRKIMTMKFLKESTLQEISKATGQSKNTVAVKIHRAVAMLKILYLKPSKKKD